MNIYESSHGNTRGPKLCARRRFRKKIISPTAKANATNAPNVPPTAGPTTALGFGDDDEEGADEDVWV
ncbi:MAG TPA: hypothetical protein VGO47_07250 [Chlamydiales bacterium]|nr:hypothetical protein [Chlamydiales bacterium]